MITTLMWVIIVIIILVLLMILVLKMTKKYQITWYWCQNIRGNMVEKRVKKFGQGSPPPPFRAMPERKHFFLVRASLTTKWWDDIPLACLDVHSHNDIYIQSLYLLPKSHPDHFRGISVAKFQPRLPSPPHQFRQLPQNNWAPWSSFDI